jgi:hypothetical protein
MKVVARLRNRARQHSLLVLLDTILQGENPKQRIVQRGLTRICIEGYPRSANTWAVCMFLEANKGHVGHHTHATANIARALRYGIPAIVLIRNPIEAITSAVIAQDRGDVDGEVAYYLTFYRWVEPRADSLVVADFDEITNDFNRVIRRVNEKYDTAFNCISDPAAAAKRVRQLIRDNVRVRRINALRWEAIPHAERESLKEKVRPMVSRHEQISEAQALYARLT